MFDDFYDNHKTTYWIQPILSMPIDEMTRFA